MDADYFKHLENFVGSQSPVNIDKKMKDVGVPISLGKVLEVRRGQQEAIKKKHGSRWADLAYNPWGFVYKSVTHKY